MLVLQSLLQRFLKLSLLPSLSGYCGQCRMYETLQKDYYWPNMNSNVYKTVKNCHSCANSDCKLKHKPKLELFSATVPVEFV